VSSEVDNFILDMFKYLNIRVLDINDTDLIKEFDRANKFITGRAGSGHSVPGALQDGREPLRLYRARLSHEREHLDVRAVLSVREAQSACINPNDGFLKQLRMYESILQKKNKAINNFFDQLPPPSSVSSNTGGSDEQPGRVKSSIERSASLMCSTNLSGSTCSLPAALACLSPKNQ
jgi:protein phosphatase slingshot